MRVAKSSSARSKRKVHIFDDEAIFDSVRLCSDFAIQRGPWVKPAHCGTVLRQFWRGDDAAVVICLDEQILFRGSMTDVLLQRWLLFT